MDKTHQLKHISDADVCYAVHLYHQRPASSPALYPYQVLSLAFSLPEKLTYRACERAYRRELILYGTSLRTAWLTRAGQLLLIKEGYING